MPPFDLALWIPLFLLLCCSIEDSRELTSIKRSHVLCYSIRLVLEILVSIARFPIRCLAFARVCKASHVHEFFDFTGDITRLFDLQTEEERVLDAAHEDMRRQLGAERKHNEDVLRMKIDLSSKEFDVVRLRREKSALEVRLREMLAERTALHQKFDQRSEEYVNLSEDAVEDRTRLLKLVAEEQESATRLQGELDEAGARIRQLVAKLKDKEDDLAKEQEFASRVQAELGTADLRICELAAELKSKEDALAHALMAEAHESASRAQAELETANVRIEDLTAKLKSADYALAQSKATSKRLADEKQQYASSISVLDSQRKRLKDNNREACRTMAHTLEGVNKRHAHTTRRLLLVIVMLHGSCHSLASRCRSVLRAKDVVLSRSKYLSNRRVDANRRLIRHLNRSEDLEKELHRDSERNNSLEKEVLMYRQMYHDSVKARHATAQTFVASYRRVEFRYSAMISNLLSGLLVLWRLNSISSKRLALAYLSISSLSHELETAHDLLHPDTSEVGIQCNPPVIPPRVLADVAIQSSLQTPPRSFSSASTQCSPQTPPRSFACTSIQCSPQTPPRVLSAVSVQCSPSPVAPSREFVNVSTQTVTKTKPPRSVVSPPPVSLPQFVLPSESNLSFGSFSPSPEDHSDTGVGAPLLLPAPFANPVLSTSSPVRECLDGANNSAELNDRVARLLKKFDALGSVHHAYRELLLERTRASSALPQQTTGLSSGLSSRPQPPSRLASQSSSSAPSRPQSFPRSESRESVFNRRRSLAMSIHAS